MKLLSLVTWVVKYIGNTLFNVGVFLWFLLVEIGRNSASTPPSNQQGNTPGLGAPDANDLDQVAHYSSQQNDK